MHFLKHCFWLLCWLLSASVQAQTPSKPTNILYIMADDLGCADVSFYGGEGVETPHIDALARNGMKATKCHAGAAVCTPSRASVLTGNYPLRYDIRKHFEDKDEHLPAGVQTLPKLLAAAGYATAHVGKWHLGGVRQVDIDARKQGQPSSPGPMQHGFAHYLASIEDPPTRHKLVYELKSLYREGSKFQLRNDANAAPTEQHIADLQTDEAIGLMRRFGQEGKPFFLNLWYDAPHTTYEPAPEPHLSRYAKRGTVGDLLLFRSMVWKLLATPEQPLELFDLESDPREIHNLLAQQPEIVQNLMQEIRQFYNAPRKSWQSKN